MSDKHGNVVALRPIQFASPTPDPRPPAPRIPPAPYEAFDEMDIVTLRDYIRAMDLMHGYIPTMIHKEPAVSLCNGTMQPADVAEWEWDHIVKKRGKMTDGKLRQWVRGHTPEILASLGEGVDKILNPTPEKETAKNMAELTKAPNLFARLNLGRNGAPAPAPAPAPTPEPAPAPAPVQSVPTLNVPAKAETKGEPAKVAPKAAEKGIEIPSDIRTHPNWETLVAVAAGLKIDLAGFVANQEEVYGAALAALNDRDMRIRYAHENLPKFLEIVMTHEPLPTL